MIPFALAGRVMAEAVASGVTPCAVAEVGDARRAIWREASGRIAGGASSPVATPDTVFDLASLTKVLATASLAMRLADAGALDLSAPVAGIVRAWRGADRADVTVADLLSHASGLPAHAPLYRSCQTPDAFERAIGAMPLEYAPRSASVYSDLGFIVLGFVLERIAGSPLDEQFDGMRDVLRGAGDGDPSEADVGPAEVVFRPPAAWSHRIAPTRPAPEQPSVAHDENAAALGGVAGHAGLFGTAPGVGRLARAMLRAVTDTQPGPVLTSPETARRFVRRASIPGSSRALGWDTMLPTSSCGTRLSPQAFGHTGFTGTSLWIDPQAGLYFVLLANRVYPHVRDAEGVTAFRRAFHDAAMADWALSNRAG